MTVDSQVTPILEAMASRPTMDSLPLDQTRQQYDAMRLRGFGPDLIANSVESLSLPGPSGKISAKLYRCNKPERRGLLIQIHGGGFVAGSIAGYEKESHAFSVLGECNVLTFDYRLAPENKFPAAYEDTLAVISWAFNNAKALDCDPRKVAILGDSAGGNIAAAASITAKNCGWSLALQVLIYPNVDYTQTYPSMDMFADLPSLTAKGVAWAKSQYLSEEDEQFDWRVSPMRAPGLKDLAPALIITGECDVLRDEAEAYASALKAAGVDVTLRRYPGMPHGFFAMGAYVDQARLAVEETCATLKEYLS
jgi:acetyl esterase